MVWGLRGRAFVLVAVVVAALLVALPSVVLRASNGQAPPVAGDGSSSSPVSLRSSPATPGSWVEIAPGYSPPQGVIADGPVPAALPMTVDVALAIPDPAALAGFVSAAYTPGTPEYHQFLSPSSLAERFGAPSSEVAVAQAYFERFGLSAVPSPDHILLTVTGSSSQIGAAFGTGFEVYRSDDGHWFVSHPTPATLPPVASWAGAYGLGNVTPLIPSTATLLPLAPDLAPAATCSGSVEILLPCQLWQAYDVSSLVSSGTNGSGVRIAVVDAYSSREPQSQIASDLVRFAAETDLSVGTVNYLYPDPPPGNLNVSTNPGWALEDALDVEWARAGAPGATIDMTFSPDADSGLYSAVDWLVAHQAANVISMSWGEPDVGIYNAVNGLCFTACNASTDGSYGLLSPVLAFAAAEGITVFAASGDCGSADGTSGVSTNFPASDPYVTGVGGTVLTVDSSGDYLSEIGWSGNESGAALPGCVNGGGSGGGYSPFPRPWWQTGLPAATTGRGVPDVAIDADTPGLLVQDGQNTQAAGTSVGTVLWAGLTAIADQYAGTALGFLNPSLYAIAAGSNYSVDFHDILVGNNGYSAGTGWDPVTGLGSPQFANLVRDLVHPASVPSSTLASFLYATPRYGPAPLTVSFRVDATGGTGTYPLEGVSFGDGNASFAPGGTVPHTYDVPGVYSAQAYVADSIANYSLSPPLAIVVGGGTALSVTLVASTTTPARGASVVFSASVSGGKRPYAYNFSFGDGTYLDGSPDANTTHGYGVAGSFCAAVVVSDSASPPDGGASGRVGVDVGGAGIPNCRNDTVPLTMTPNATVGVRDAPADFPDLFTVSGGATNTGGLPPSLQYTSTDPYVAACGCAIFRSPGVFPVTGYANDSENEEATASTEVTVGSPLDGTFTASPTYGPAPLTVSFHASATGGYGTNVASTRWTFGNGNGSLGASASETYASPGVYLAVGQLSDLGDGNASEAFLIDVGSPTAYLVATIAPAAHVSLASTVNFSAVLVAADGSPVPSSVAWDFGPDFGGFRPDLNWTYSAPLPVGANDTLNVTLNVTDLASDPPSSVGLTSVAFHLSDFGAVEASGFSPRGNALELAGTGGPERGVAPLLWSGSTSVTGPGTLSETWELGSGVEEFAPAITDFFDYGLHTVTVNASDTWGDEATEVFPVAVSAPLTVNATLSGSNGTAPFLVTFRANATGGFGPPYRFRWSFGDGGVGSGPNATHTYGSPGSYRVTLNVTDAGGGSVLRSWNVTVGTGGFPLVLVGAGLATGVIAAVVATALRPRSRGRPPTPSRPREGPIEPPAG